MPAASRSSSPVPGQKPSRVSAPVSLLDLLPTVLDIAAGDGLPIEPVSGLEGESLLAAVLGERALRADRPVFSEMNADGTFSPSFMVRKGDWKYICCEGDPPMLFDLRNDPDELQNLAGTNPAARIEGEMQKLVEMNWSPEAVKNDMQQSARRRAFIQHARDTAGSPPWDYQPRKEDASKQYVRGGGTAGATKAKARYPLVPARTPDSPD